METIKKIKSRHEKEIEELQKNCKHEKISDWMNWAWAPGHFFGMVKVCEICGKVIERTTPELPNLTIWGGPDEEYRIQIDAGLERGAAKMSMTADDRLTYNDDGETLDEVVLSNASVHLEQLDDTIFMLRMENNQHHWHLRIGSRSGKAKVDAWVYEEY